MKRVFYLFILIINLSAYAQKSGRIEAIVLDSENNPIEFVNVFLTSVNDSTTIVNATITNNTGDFILTNVPFGNYHIHFQFIGFVNYQQTVLLNDATKNIDIGTITLRQDAIALNSVEITAFRNLIQKTEEGIVVNALENLTQIGGTAADLMKNMPGVQVDMEGNLSMRGKPPLIMINGRVSGIGGVDRVTNLNQIPASSIERIEIITNPSAKYDADAESGIINIILKKGNENLGTTGASALGGGFGARYRINGSFLINHNTPKWNLGLAYDNWFTTRTRTVNRQRTQYDSDDKYFLSQPREDERTIQTQTARFNVGYTPNKKNSFRLEGIWLFEGQDNDETIVSTTETSSHDFTSRNSRFSNEIRRFHTGELLFNYTRNFNQNRVLSIDASSAIEYNRENTYISTQNLTEQNSLIGDSLFQKTHFYEDANLTNFSINYLHPIKEIGIIETGYKSTFRFINDDYGRFNQQTDSLIADNFITDESHTDIFKFNEQIHAFYLQYTGWTGTQQEPKLKYQFGIRPEQVLNTGDNAQSSYNFSNNYFHLYPSASLIYYTHRRNSYKLAYSKRINRPSIGHYSPFIDITDSLNVWSGNPDIEPEISHAIEFTCNHAFKNASFSTSLFSRFTSNSIFPYTTIDSSEVSITRPENFGNSSTYGVEVIFTYNPFDFWRINIDASLYEQRIEQNAQFQNTLKNQLSGYAKFINNFDVWKNGRFQITANYTSPIAIPQGLRKEVYFIDLGFQQKILKGQGRLALTVTDIFDTQSSETTISGSNFEYTHYRKVDTRAIVLIFAYTFKSEFKEELLENKFKNE
ncbi:MAG: TonB-dependent receptor [Bacteroidota bacterium]|nr:TonB-dependent receptor [Bacteroidota bacterium]